MSGASCPYCRTAFESDDAIVACSGCQTEHHADCLQENGGCTVFGCSQAPAEEPKISVSDQDLVSGTRTQPPPSAQDKLFSSKTTQNHHVKPPKPLEIAKSPINKGDFATKYLAYLPPPTSYN